MNHFRASSLLALVALVAFVAGHSVAQGPTGMPTKLSLKNVRVQFDPAAFEEVYDSNTGMTTIRFIAPVQPPIQRPPDTMAVSCSGVTCSITTSPTSAELYTIDLYRNGLYQTEGADYTADLGTKTLTLLTPVEGWERLNVRLTYRP